MAADYNLLRKAELFTTLLDEDLDFLAGHTKVLEASPGDILFKPGDKAEGFFFLLSGSVSLHRLVDHNLELRLATWHAGEVFGEFHFVMGLNRDATATVDEPCQLLRFPLSGQTLDHLTSLNPASMSRVMLRSTAMVASRLRSTNRLITENSAWLGDLKKQILMDPATGLWNRTFLDEDIVANLAKPSALIVIKPDRFKLLVDGRGHHAGDEAMLLIRDLLTAETEALGRGYACRVRSNETALVIPSFGPEETAALADHLAGRLAQLVIPASGPHPEFRFTASVAWSLWPGPGTDWQALVRLTHEKALAVWEEGGNRVCPL